MPLGNVTFANELCKTKTSNMQEDIIHARTCCASPYRLMGKRVCQQWVLDILSTYGRRRAYRVGRRLRLASTRMTERCVIFPTIHSGNAATHLFRCNWP